MDNKTYRVVGIRKNGTRAVMVDGLPLVAASKAVLRLIDEDVFVGVLIEADVEPADILWLDRGTQLLSSDSTLAKS